MSVAMVKAAARASEKNYNLIERWVSGREEEQEKVKRSEKFFMMK